MGENPKLSQAWKEPPIQSAFDRPDCDTADCDMGRCDKRRPDNGLYIRKSTTVKGTKHICERVRRIGQCDDTHEHA